MCYGCGKPGHIKIKLQESMAKRSWSLWTKWSQRVQARRCVRAKFPATAAASDAEPVAEAVHGEEAAAPRAGACSIAGRSGTKKQQLFDE